MCIPVLSMHTSFKYEYLIGIITIDMSELVDFFLHVIIKIFFMLTKFIY